LPTSKQTLPRVEEAFFILYPKLYPTATIVLTFAQKAGILQEIAHPLNKNPKNNFDINVSLDILFARGLNTNVRHTHAFTGS